MTNVTVLGMGPMGRALATAFVGAGHPTTVWNRTPGKAGPVVALGATEAPSAHAAVSTADLVVVCVIDYAAVREILRPTTSELTGRTVVNLTADSPDAARDLASWADEQGFSYLDGCLLTPAPTIGGPAGVALFSGPSGLFARHEAVLRAIGGTVIHLGEDPGRAAAHDVSLLDMFWTGLSGLVHGYALALSEGIEAGEIGELAAGIVGLLPDIARQFARRIDDRDFSGDISSIASAHAGMEHIIQTARQRGVDAGVLEAAVRITQRAVDDGDGELSTALLAHQLRVR